MSVLEEPIKEAMVLCNYIGGEWVASKAAEQAEVVNPATRQTLA